MNLEPKTRQRVLIVASFAAAVVLSIMPVPAALEAFRPDWAGLVLVYWTLMRPERVNVGTGFSVGLVLDVLYGSLLGQHALALTALAFATHRLHLQIRMFPRWQQAVTVFVLVGLSHVLVLWIKSATGQRYESWAYWLPSIVSALLWPWLYLILQDLSRRAKFG